MRYNENINSPASRIPWPIIVPNLAITSSCLSEVIRKIKLKKQFYQLQVKRINVMPRRRLKN
jgi:hypothetical protein